MAVPGGDLAVEVAPGKTEPVLAIHGISSSRRLWLWLQEVAPDVTLVMPDLRGRCDSLSVEGPSSVARHADDLALVLDDLGLESVHVIGMSMGGFVAMQLAASHPGRVKSLVLVDGGFPMAAPPGLTRENLSAVFADRVGRLERTWDGVEAYLDYFCSATAPLLDRDDPVLRRYLEHDLVAGRVRLSGQALIEDAEDVFFGDSPWESVDVPVRFSHAEWSVGTGTPPGYPPELVERYGAHAALVVGLPGLDHAASIMSRRGAMATAEMVREALA